MRRINRTTPTINPGTLADVAFLLLIFFMVVTTIQRHKAISMKLPPLVESPAQKISEDKVLTIMINAKNKIMIENKQISVDFDQLINKQLCMMIELKKKPIINVHMHPEANYQTYLEMLSEIKKGIRLAKAETALKLFDKNLKKLTREEYIQLTKVCGIRIMEREMKL